VRYTPSSGGTGVTAVGMANIPRCEL
jgi:hypothetical protein